MSSRIAPGFLKAFLISVCCLFTATACSAEPEVETSHDWEAIVAAWQLPPGEHSPAIAGFLESLKLGDADFTKDYVSSFVVEAARADVLASIEGLRAELDQFVVEGLLLQSALEVDVILQDQADGGSWSVRLTFVEAPQLKLSSITYELKPRLYPAVPQFTSLSAVEGYLAPLVEDEIFAGTILISSREGEFYRKSFGLADNESQRPVDATTRFDIGSITKLFTEIVVRRLVAEGKLDLDAKIGTYIDQLPEEMLQGPTVGQVVEMRGGFGHYYDDPFYWTNPADFSTIEDIMPLIASMPLMFEPGTEQMYSNSGYVVLGAIIEAATGQSYFDAVQSNVFDPAGMAESGFFSHEEAVAKNLTTPYSFAMSANGELVDVRDNFNLRGGPDGGSYSTADDLLRLSRALKEGVFPGGENLMLLQPSPEGQGADGKLTGLLTAAGGAQGVSAVFLNNFDESITVIVLANRDEPIAEEIGMEIFRMMHRQ